MNQWLKLMNKWFKLLKQWLKSMIVLEILVSKMFVCAMPYVLVPVVLQWDVIVLDDCVPGVFVMVVLYDCVHNICLQDIYPRCLCIWWLCGGCGCAASLSLMPKFEMSVCRMFAINVCLENDCVALMSFLWWDLLPSLPLCGISACWMAEICLCVSRISSLDECLLDNCLKNVRVLNG